MMAERVQKQKSNSEQVTEEVQSSEVSTAQGDKLKSELDDLLDEIDDVLESNAEDFVKSYVQKGGE
jgi:ubiquitin-like protein Pup